MSQDLQRDGFTVFFQEEDKDLIEMRRRALESMARGRLQQQNQKKVIVPLNQDSSSGTTT